VHIGGHNSIQRKQTPKVLAAFVEASKFRRDIHLTVTMMSDQSEYIVTHLPPNVTLIDRILSHAEILKLYECCDVSIQVSSHEGLGLGFYESISRGTPVISLDVPPHNEVVLRGKTGWLLKTTDQALPDNDDGIVKAAKFRIKDLHTCSRPFRAPTLDQ
jgi:glycosyltransferase involved in cell wall biosynthesis